MESPDVGRPGSTDSGALDLGVFDLGARDTGTPDAGFACDYPAGAVEPMALGEVIPSYAWSRAIAGDDAVFDLDLSKVHCNDDEDIDWSPFDVLLFISIPAW